MKVLAFLLLIAAPAFCDTLYTFSGNTVAGNGVDLTAVGFAYNATTNEFPGGDPRSGYVPNWPWDIYNISFTPAIADGQPSTQMDLGMIGNDGSGGPISVSYSLIGFTGAFGTYTAQNSMLLGGPGDTGPYGTPGFMTLTVTDPPPANSDVPEPASFGLIALVGILAFSLRYLKLSFQRQ